MLPLQNIQGFSGATAVGSLAFLGWALITNAFAENFFPVINLYAQSPTWAIVAAIPAISLAYLLGLLCIGTGEIVLVRLKLIPANSEEDRTLARWQLSNVLTTRYQQLQQDADILAGSGMALTLIVLGASLHAWRVEGWRHSLISIAICALIIAYGSVALSVRRKRLASAIAHLISDVTTLPRGENAECRGGPEQ